MDNQHKTEWNTAVTFDRMRLETHAKRKHPSHECIVQTLKTHKHIITKEETI